MRPIALRYGTEETVTLLLAPLAPPAKPLRQGDEVVLRRDLHGDSTLQSDSGRGPRSRRTRSSATASTACWRRRSACACGSSSTCSAAARSSVVVEVRVFAHHVQLEHQLTLTIDDELADAIDAAQMLEEFVLPAAQRRRARGHLLRARSGRRPDDGVPAARSAAQRAGSGARGRARRPQARVVEPRRGRARDPRGARRGRRHRGRGQRRASPARRAPGPSRRRALTAAILRAPATISSGGEGDRSEGLGGLRLLELPSTSRRRATSGTSVSTTSRRPSSCACSAPGAWT